VPRISQPANTTPFLSRPALVAGALALLHLVLAGITFNPTPHVGGDSGTYVALARSLLERHAYVDLWDPARPPHTQFPPVFPGIVALAIVLGIGSWVGLKLVVLAFSCAAVAVCYLWLRRITSPRLALATAAVLAVAPGVLDLSHWELSDVPFWCFTVLALWAFSHFDAAERRTDARAAGQPRNAHDAEAPRAAAHTERDRSPGGAADASSGRRKGRKPDRARPGTSSAPAASAERPADSSPAHPTRWLVLAAAFTALADLTRSAGLPLVLAAGVWLVWRHGWRRAALYAAVAGPGIAAWWLRGRASGGGYTGFLWYVDPYQPGHGTVTALDMMKRIGWNTARYTLQHVPTLLVEIDPGPVIEGAIGVAVVALALAGWARRLRRAGLEEIWMPLYAGVLLLWPVTWSAERLVLPILPLLMVYAAEAGRDALARAGWRRRLPALGLTAAAVLAMVPGITGEARVGTACTAAYADGETFPCLDPEFGDFMNLAAKLRGRLPAGTVVLSRKPTLFYAVSGYPSRVYPLTADPDSFFRAASAAHARYVVVDQIADLAPMYLQPVLLARRTEFCVIPDPYFPNAALARIDPGGPPPGPNAPPNAFRRCAVPLPPAS
jgi:hypothetical protein